MAISATLFVTIQNASAKPLSGATVNAQRAGERSRISFEESDVRQYLARGLEPGEYSIRVSRRGYLTEILGVTLIAGMNAIGLVLGCRSQPYYYADGRRIYCKPDKEHLLVAVEGGGARRATGEILSERALDNAYLTAVPLTGTEDREGCFR